jgi:hypothetical protein
MASKYVCLSHGNAQEKSQVKSNNKYPSLTLSNLFWRIGGAPVAHRTSYSERSFSGLGDLLCSFEPGVLTLIDL